MTLRYLLDTNICIFAMKGRGGLGAGLGAGLGERFEREGDGLAISSVTLAELAYGVEKSAAPARNTAALAAFAARLAVLDFDAPAAEAYGRLRAGLERAGRVIGPYDLMIAAHALSRGLAVVTDNRREFDRVEGLAVEDWTAKDRTAED